MQVQHAPKCSRQDDSLLSSMFHVNRAASKWALSARHSAPPAEVPTRRMSAPWH